MIKVERVVIKNFMKYDTLDFTFKPGVTSVIGPNRSGKSTLIEAVYWCLTGKRARGGAAVFKRDAKADATSMVGLYGRKDGVPFIVVREAKRKGAAVLAIEVDGNQSDYTTGNLTLDQKKLDLFLGLDPQFLLSSMLVGHNSFRFSRAKDSERKAIFERILNLDVYQAAQKIAAAKAKELREEVRECEVSAAAYQGIVDDLESQLAATSAAGAKEIEALKVKQKKVSVEARECLKKLGVRPVQFSKELETMRNKWKPELRAQERAAELADAEIRRLEEEGICVVCGQAISESKRSHLIKEQTRLCDLAATRVRELKASIRGVESRLEFYSGFLELESECERIAGELARLQKKPGADLQPTINKNKKELTRLAGLKRKSERALNAYAFWEKGFGRQGVISLLMDAAINEVNQHLIDIAAEMTDNAIVAQYSTTTELKSKSGVSDKLSLVCVIDGEPCEYEDLSNSEQQRVDIMTIFAIRRMIRANFEAVDLTFYDEVFESFDEETTETVFKYMRDEHKGESVYVISHVTETQFKADRVLRVEPTAAGSRLR